jgi:hypothetical protein
MIVEEAKAEAIIAIDTVKPSEEVKLAESNESSSETKNVGDLKSDITAIEEEPLSE